MRNYPWYKGIWAQFKEKDLVVIGIHTPETDSEKNVKNVQKKMKAEKIDFPIAIDNKLTMWRSYSNQYWPTVYLIDKKGIVRWGWVGELGYKGAKGEALMKEKVEDLLKE